MRIVWNATVFQQDEEPTRNGTRSDIGSVLAEISGERAETFLPSQKIASTVAKGQVEDSGFTLTIEYTSALPSSLLIDTRLPPSGFGLSNVPSSTSSSFALPTSLPMIAVIVLPAAMVLPQLDR
ncbi:hypothetical protein ONS95_014819 [Cadophora gregata]|uniref:uncharacterized protein n=1 Tax=Cadophora gregata TaxID=51156 RepID=UPI0026DC1AC6|nr:uncharacterized protein ONS95_014819 [Cadophora gregata]KAK0113115.1 hypothetical protein ONS95_014819 [Cadophora gregata]